jgi:hypothetical protein
MKNSKKMKKSGPFAVCVHTAKDFWSLCRVHTHGKGATWRSPVRLGAPGGVPVGDFAVRPCMLAHGKECRTAQLARTAKNARTAKSRPHGNGSAHGSPARARQSQRARQRACRTAAQRTHGSVLCRANCRRARQWCRCRRKRCRAVFAVRPRTATSLPCKQGPLPCELSHGSVLLSRSER